MPCTLIEIKIQMKAKTRKKAQDYVPISLAHLLEHGLECEEGGNAAARSSREVRMERSIGRRLAGHILKANYQRPSFDIDLLDERSCEIVARELRKTGCIIVREPHSFALHVTTREMEG